MLPTERDKLLKRAQRKDVELCTDCGKPCAIKAGWGADGGYYPASVCCEAEVVLNGHTLEASDMDWQ